MRHNYRAIHRAANDNALSRRIFGQKRSSGRTQYSYRTHNPRMEQISRATLLGYSQTALPRRPNLHPHENYTASDFHQNSMLMDDVDFGEDNAETQVYEVTPLILLMIALTSIAFLALIFFQIIDNDNAIIELLIPVIFFGLSLISALYSPRILWLALVILTALAVLASLMQITGFSIASDEWVFILPLILSLVMILSTFSRTRSIMIGALACGYLWISVLILKMGLTALAAGSLLFILGISHHRLGKAWNDRHIYFAQQHTLMGWVVAMIGLVWAQHYFMPFGNLDANKTGINASQSFYWLLGTTLGFTAIIMSVLLRLRHGLIGPSGITALIAGSLILPIIAYKPDLLNPIFMWILALPYADIYHGFAIGAVIITLSIAFAINGYRRNQRYDILAAAVMIVLQIMILLHPRAISLDGIIIMLITMIFAITIEILIARRSLIRAG